MNEHHIICTITTGAIHSRLATSTSFHYYKLYDALYESDNMLKYTPTVATNAREYKLLLQSSLCRPNQQTTHWLHHRHKHPIRLPTESKLRITHCFATEVSATASTTPGLTEKEHGVMSDRITTEEDG